MASELTVRPATLRDAPALSAFAARTFREAFSHMVPPDTMAQYLDDSFPEARVATEIVDPDTVFLIITDSSGDFVGYCKLHFGSSPPVLEAGGLPEHPRIPVKLWRLYTVKEWQGRGVGVQLLEHAAMIASKRHGAILWLTVNTGNTGAVRFYERNGFVQVGFTTFDLGGDMQKDFVMVRQLPAVRDRRTSVGR
ncbi:MAG: GNAT family N-acetyltransferase [Fibrella sp.]|nr:GNAT family N-acetyltransferase [Armatimonadota bacterium]